MAALTAESCVETFTALSRGDPAAVAQPPVCRAVGGSSARLVGKPVFSPAMMHATIEALQSTLPTHPNVSVTWLWGLETAGIHVCTRRPTVAILFSERKSLVFDAPKPATA